MHKNIEELTSELIGLPKRERLEVVRFLLFLNNHSSDSSHVRSAWEKEISNRVQAVEDGTAVGIRLIVRNPLRLSHPQLFLGFHILPKEVSLHYSLLLTVVGASH
jgi:hypothetical protein